MTTNTTSALERLRAELRPLLDHQDDGPLAKDALDAAAQECDKIIAAFEDEQRQARAKAIHLAAVLELHKRDRSDPAWVAFNDLITHLGMEDDDDD